MIELIELEAVFVLFVAGIASGFVGYRVGFERGFRSGYDVADANREIHRLERALFGGGNDGR